MTVWLNTVSRPEGRSRRRKKGRASNTRAREKEMGEKSKTRLVYVRFMRPDLVSARLLYIYIYIYTVCLNVDAFDVFFSLPCTLPLLPFLSLSFSFSLPFGRSAPLPTFRFIRPGPFVPSLHSPSLRRSPA